MSDAKSRMSHHQFRHSDNDLMRIFKARAEQVTRTAAETTQRIVARARERPWVSQPVGAQPGDTATSRVTAQDLQRAWSDLQSHPALQWTPPLWRADSDKRAGIHVTDNHAERAIERNLKVELIAQPNGMMQVRLITGPLRDKPTPSGIDPLTPVAELNPRLAVCAATFEDAVVELRDAVVDEYGPSSASR
jgi:hypothetical protein